MEKASPIVVKDSKSLRNVLVQVNIKDGLTTVISDSSAWDNIAYLIEALKVTVEKCVQSGMNRREVLGEAKNYLSKVFIEKTWAN